MDLITWLANTSYRLLDVDEVAESFEQRHFQIAERFIKKFRGKDVKANVEIVKQLAKNGLLNFWSEVTKYTIVLLIATKLNIFLPVFLIMNIFSSLRWVAGGVHMSTFNKCFAVMIFFFLSLGYLVTNVDLNTIHTATFLTIGLIWSIYIAYKYAPQERIDKSDKDCENGNKMKHKTILIIIICYLISLLFMYNQLISLSIFTGILLEMFTITPIGTKLFQWIDKGGVIAK